MSSFLQTSSAYNSITGSAIAGTDLYEFGKNIQRNFDGSPNKVSFIANNVTCVEFDASLQETHGVEAKATDYPVESGATISDHIVVAPLQLELSCIVTDTPFHTRANLLKNLFTTTVNAVSGSLGVVAFNAAQRFASINQQAVSPSGSTFEQLLRMCAGDPAASPPVPPSIFDVVTKLRRYPSMVMTGLSVPQDATTGQALVFSMRLQQIRTVKAATTTIKQLKAPVVAAGKEKKGEVEALFDKVTQAAKQGVNQGDAVTLHEKTYGDL